jgi:hypothetical protein
MNTTYDNSIMMLADDDELTLLTAYLTLAMSDDETEAFEDRLRDDEAFFHRVAPFIKLWYSRAPGYGAAQTEQRIRAPQVASPVAFELSTTDDARPVTPIGPRITLSHARSRIAPFRRHVIAVATALAAGLVFLFTRDGRQPPPSATSTMARLPADSQLIAPATDGRPDRTASHKQVVQRTEATTVVAAEVPAVPMVPQVSADSVLLADSLHPFASATRLSVDSIVVPHAVPMTVAVIHKHRTYTNHVKTTVQAIGEKIRSILRGVRRSPLHKPTLPTIPIR